MNITLSSGAALGLLGSLLLVAACSGEHAGQAAPPAAQDSKPPAAVSPLTRQSWELRRMTAGGASAPLPAGTKASITFNQNNGVTGYSGVNTFTGSYAQEGTTLRWTTPFASTRRGGPPGAMAFERTFLLVLRACVKLEEADGLTLSGPEGDLTFSPGPPRP